MRSSTSCVTSTRAILSRTSRRLFGICAGSSIDARWCAPWRASLDQARARPSLDHHGHPGCCGDRPGLLHGLLVDVSSYGTLEGPMDIRKLGTISSSPSDLYREKWAITFKSGYYVE